MNRRIASLDSLRGLAALTVVFCHCLGVIPAIYDTLYGSTAGSTSSPWVRALIYSPLHLLSAGHEAVILFFVLSGFVLALPFLEHREPAYAGYLVKRVSRIYLPYIAVTLLGMLLSMTIPRGGAGLSRWFDVNWANPITLRTVVDHILMLGNTYNDVNGVTWSLVHEMRISLAFPIIALLVRRKTWRFSIATAIGLSLTGLVLMVLVGNPGESVYYAGFFVLGAVIAKYRSSVADRLRRVSPWLILALALTLYDLQWILPSLNWLVTDCLTAVGAGGLILLALSWPAASAVLNRPALVWLGKVSYSLYLVHTLVLLSLAHLFASPWLLIATPPLSILLAGVLHRFVEEPSTALGRNWPVWPVNRGGRQETQVRSRG